MKRSLLLLLLLGLVAGARAQSAQDYPADPSGATVVDRAVLTTDSEAPVTYYAVLCTQGDQSFLDVYQGTPWQRLHHWPIEFQGEKVVVPARSVLQIAQDQPGQLTFFWSSYAGYSEGAVHLSITYDQDKKTWTPTGPTDFFNTSLHRVHRSWGGSPVERCMSTIAPNHRPHFSPAKFNTLLLPPHDPPPLENEPRDTSIFSPEARRMAAQEPPPSHVDADHPWDNTRYSLDGATNAHRTNTVEEMTEALDHDTDWLEGDIREEIDRPGQIEARHDEGREPGDNLTFDQWLDAGLASGRGLKLDIKEPELTPQILDQLEERGVPDERLMFNLKAEDIARYGPEIRERFPDAILAINPPDQGLTPEGLARMAQLADELGGQSTFVIREDLLSDEAVQALQGHGSISIWNDPSRPADGSIEERTRELRERGVNGVIDLR